MGSNGTIDHMYKNVLAHRSNLRENIIKIIIRDHLNQTSLVDITNGNKGGKEDLTVSLTELEEQFVAIRHEINGVFRQAKLPVPVNSNHRMSSALQKEILS